MGPRLVAHYYDRVEALVVSGALEAAGVANWVENYLQNSVQPFHEIAFGGYRVIVCPEDLQVALDVIDQARAAPIMDGGHLTSRPVVTEFMAWLYPVTLLVPALWLVSFALGVLLPLRRRGWADS